MTSRKSYAALLLTAVFLSADLLSAQEHKIWSDTPVELESLPIWKDKTRKSHRLWENSAYPLGNGNIGLTVLSSPSSETVILNEKSLWTGGPSTTEDPGYYWKVNKVAHPLLPEIREALLKGDQTRATQLVEENFNGLADYETSKEKDFRFGHYTVAGALTIRTGADAAQVEDFERGLCLDSAYTYTNFRKGDQHWHRKAFVSYPDRVAVLSFEADTVQHLEIGYEPGPCLEGSFRFQQNTLLYSGKLQANGLSFALRLKALAPAAEVSWEGGRLIVDGKGPVTLLLTMDTGYRMNFNPDEKDPATYEGEHPERTTRKWMKRAARKGYAELFSDHVKDFRALFGRTTLELNPDAADRSGLPTAERLEAYGKGAEDYALESLYLYYGRYLLISSSRAGTLPANLQGIWTDEVDGPWHVDYHNNINIQMNYWPSMNGNLAECAGPYLDYIRMLTKTGQETAAAYYNAAGWTASISGNIYGFTAPMSSKMMSWNMIPAAGPWLAIDVWNYYDFTRDLDYLKKTGYDIIAGSARFVCDYLWQMPDGRYTAAPSTSPEHGDVDLGCTFVHAVCRELLTHAIEASELLKRNNAETEEWKKVRDHIVPYQIGRYGQLQEWFADIDDPDDQHRHINHLFGVYPGTEITMGKQPELAEAAKVVLNHRGDGATGWSMGWKLNLWARLQDGNRAYRLFRNLLHDGTYDNLWCAHPPFQIDGNFGGAAGLIEMLLQSHDGCIHLLPALPEKWQTGKLTGAIARGGFEIGLSWKDGRLEEASLLSRKGGECVLSYEGEQVRFETVAGKHYRVKNADGLTVCVVE